MFETSITNPTLLNKVYDQGRLFGGVAKIRCEANNSKTTTKFRKSPQKYLPLYHTLEISDMKKKILLPIGISEFDKLIQHRDSENNPYTFVDKSLLIKAFIDAGSAISLVTRPRRFGKTINLSMLEHFFAPEVNGIKTQGLFDGLNISKHPEAMKYQGQYQSIFITLKTVKGGNFDTFYAGIKQQIAKLFEQHEDYLFSHNIKEAHKKLYNNITDKKAAQEEYAGALLFLSELLYKASGKQVYLFVDEYDTPIHDAYIKGYYNECTAFLAKMFNTTFKGNPYLAKAMITGILKVGKASLFSDLNNVTVYSMLEDKRYNKHFGFTEEETDALLDKAGLPTKAHKLKEMYNGYEVGGSTLYNPWSIVNFIDNACLLPENRIQEAMKPYWVNTGGTSLLRDLLQNNLVPIRLNLERLLRGEMIETVINEEVLFNPDMQNNPIDFWSLMLLAGYLKVGGREQQGLRSLKYKLAFPNQEILQTFNILAKEVAAHGQRYLLELEDACFELIEGDTTPFERYIRHFLEHVANPRDTKGKYKEQFFHGFALGLTSCVRDTHIILSNESSGDGFYDIALEPKEIRKDIGVILELKVADNTKQDLKKLAQVARKQIQRRDYYQHMRKRGVKKILNVGVAFYHTEVEVVHEMLTY